VPSLKDAALQPGPGGHPDRADELGEGTTLDWWTELFAATAPADADPATIEACALAASRTIHRCFGDLERFAHEVRFLTDTMWRNGYTNNPTVAGIIGQMSNVQDYADEALAVEQACQ
jgi:hypothetical protein